MSKLLAQLVDRRLLKHLNNNNLLPPYKSAYRRFNSTKKVLPVLHLILESETGYITILSLLDVNSAVDAVDIVDHVFLNKLIQCCNITEKVYENYAPNLMDLN